MDGSHFDALTRSLTEPGTRRRLVGGLVAGALGFVGVRGASARACTGTGTVCRENADCCTGSCGPRDRTGRRRCACQADEQCPAGWVCGEGSCRDVCADRAAGAACATGKVCSGGGCVGNGVCTAGTGTGGGCGSAACGDTSGCITTTEGAFVCVNSGFACADMPGCPSGSADCPPGSACLTTLCPNGLNRCVPICTGT